MSVVYLAEDGRLGRRVALKLLAPELAEDEQFRERFTRESHLAASLEHPNIVPIYEAGEAGGVFFIAMRHVPGASLGALVERDGALEPGRAASVIAQIAGALDAAHDEGLVHRDVKPANILLASSKPGSPEHAYLTDFGLTKRALSETGFTKTGQFMGTIDYAAPEQFQGRPLDARTDEYSLGCVLFLALTGHPPFQRPQEAAVMYAHLQDPPPSITEERPELPAGIDGVVARAMAKEPAERFPSCSDLAAAVGEALRPVAPEPVTPPPVPPARRSRALLAVAGALASAAITAIVLLLALGGRHPAAAPSPSASSTPSGKASPSPSPTVLARPLNEPEDALLAFVPPAIQDSCGPAAQPGPGTPAASLACTDGIIQIRYFQYRLRPVMGGVFDDAVNSLDVPNGDCAIRHDAAGQYTVGGQDAGRVLCYQHGGNSYMEWTSDDLFVYSVAIRPDLGDFDLYRWWVEQAGPIAPEPGVPSGTIIPKDSSAALLAAPEGAFTARVSGASNNPLLNGLYTLDLGNHRFTLTRSGSTVPADEGGLLLAKGHALVFASTSSACAGRGTYRWFLAAGKLTFKLVGQHDICPGRGLILTSQSWTRASTSPLASPTTS